MKALDWRDIHISDPVGSRKPNLRRRLRAWFLLNGDVLFILFVAALVVVALSRAFV
jgi:hypothetical protein